MPNDSVYLDYASATVARREVLDKMLPLLCNFTGEAQGVHAQARRGQLLFSEARRTVLECLALTEGELSFLDGTYQASYQAVLGLALSRGRGHILTSADEDEGVLAACRLLESLGFQVTYLREGASRLSPAEVEGALREDTVLVSLALVNRQSGWRRPVEELASLIKERGVLFHSDLSLGVLWPVEVGVDCLTISSHLFYGPSGTSVLWRAPAVKFGVQISEGSNLSGVAGFTQALSFLVDERVDWLVALGGLRKKLVDLLETNLPDLQVMVGDHPGFLTLRMEALAAKELVYQLDRFGVCVSESPYGVRFSLGRNSTTSDLDKAVSALVKSLDCLKTMRVEAA